MRRTFPIFLLAAGALAQDSQPIRVNTQLVQVDVVVRSHAGPVADLKQNDFTLFDNGKEQKIAFFTVQTPAQRANASRSPLPAGVVSNRINRAGSEPAGATVLLWDALNTEMQDQTWVRGQVMKYLQSMNPGDPVAVYLLEKSLRVVQDFTDTPNRLMLAMSRTGAEQSADLEAPALTDLASQINSPVLAALGGPSLTELQNLAMATAAETTDYALRDRVYVTKAALEAIAEHLSGMPGRKKLAWISGSFPAVTLDQRHRVGATQIEVQDFGPQIKESIRALNAANVALYPIDPRGLTTGLTMDKLVGDPRDPNATVFREVNPGGLTATGLDTMNMLAGGTGGRAFYGTNDLEGVMRTVLEDNEVNYRLGFYPSDAKMDGAYHNLGVKVARGAAKKIEDVRFRKGYVALDTKTYRNGLWREELNELMQNPLEATKLGMSVSATPLPQVRGVYDLDLTLDLEDVHLEKIKDRWVAKIAFGTMLSPSPNTQGTLETIQLSLTESRLRAGLQNGYRLRRKIVLPDFKGTLRVAVEDMSTGAIGSVRVPMGLE